MKNQKTITKTKGNQIMTKESIKKNSPDISKLNLKTVASYAFYGALFAGVSLCAAEIAFAKYDIDAGVKAGTSPLIKALTDHWGKGVLLSGGATAMMGEGDPRQRAKLALLGSGAAGLAVLTLVAAFGD
jgi:hypothetical protein